MGVESTHIMKLQGSEQGNKRRLQRLSSVPSDLEEDLAEDLCPALDIPRPRKSGVVSMLHPCPNGLQVQLRVRLTVHDTYAVVSPDKDMSRDLGYVNLKRASVQRLNNKPAFQIVPQDCDANILTFYVNHEKDLQDWLDTLKVQERTSLLRPGRTSRSQSPINRRWSAPVGSLMPAVVEED